MVDINPQFTNEQIKKFTTENEFMSAKVELHKNTISLLHQIIHYKYFDENKISKKLTRDEAILGGNLIRLAKLNTSLVQNTCQNKLEICFILNRCIYENQINILYFLRNGEENNYKNYVKNSLITEKEFYKNIQENITKRDGQELPIEKRMKISIENSFEISDIEMEELNKSSNWKNLKKRLEKISISDDVSQTYNIFYGLSSHSIHGNWQDLIQHHIIQDDDETFTLNYDWNSPRANLLEAVILFNLIVSKDFANKKLQEPAKTEIIESYNILDEYQDFLGLQYDNFREF
ncbi:hypothetical protein SAMN05421638_1106 [Kaistella treverensis]|uniref:Uncharacterized protein n=1 Tax=Kaistella treverensis TaxID=631455 RepID=A0A1I3KZ92_9FLAO|nr:DUF5677 domain-containing protein [Kaistella treverensis]SFI77841.1 hypothetical protein SAMN05421638_1106 [Kaistella treverensis]